MTSAGLYCLFDVRIIIADVALCDSCKSLRYACYMMRNRRPLPAAGVMMRQYNKASLQGGADAGREPAEENRAEKYCVCKGLPSCRLYETMPAGCPYDERLPCAMPGCICAASFGMCPEMPGLSDTRAAGRPLRQQQRQQQRRWRYTVRLGCNIYAALYLLQYIHTNGAKTRL